MGRYIIALDEGTTSARACLYDLEKNEIVKIASREVGLIYPKPGWVEQNAGELYEKQLYSLKKILEGLPKDSVLGIGITNQRETVVLWDKLTGKPVCNAIVWQCRRTADYCKELKEKHGKLISEKTGLVSDPYFSASKVKWVLENVPECAELLKEERLAIGTVDSFLVYKLTKGKSFITDVTNASRTMLFDIRRLCWDEELLRIFGIPKSALPKVIRCSEAAGTAEIDGIKIPICGIAGDQQAAMFGQGCFKEGEAKITFGTGLFMLMNTGRNIVTSSCNMISTIAYTLGNKTVYALEGSVFNAGSAIQWLRDGMGLIENSAQSEEYALRVKDNNGVYFVPAFTGLGAPHWDSESRGIITGLTRGANKYHVVRAALEAMAYASKDLIDIMQKDSGIGLKEIRVDGGASANNFLLSFLSDITRVLINRPKDIESTALGAAYLTGLGLNLFKAEEIERLRRTDRVFEPETALEDSKKLYEGWLKAVGRCLG